MSVAKLKSKCPMLRCLGLWLRLVDLGGGTDGALDSPGIIGIELKSARSQRALNVLAAEIHILLLHARNPADDTPHMFSRLLVHVLVNCKQLGIKLSNGLRQNRWRLFGVSICTVSVRRGAGWIDEAQLLQKARRMPIV